MMGNHMRFGNNRGDSLVLSLMALAGIAALAVMVVQLVSMLQGREQVTRVKNAMAKHEAKIRAALLQPSNYICATSEVVGSESCVFQLPAFLTTPQILLGAQCAPGVPNCGVILDPNFTFDTGTRTFAGVISYSGVKPKIAGRKVSLTVPVDILQQTKSECPATTPVFLGFEASGKLKCKALATCAPGQIITAVDPATLALTCQNMPSPTGCPADQYLDSLSWPSLTSGYAITCAARLPPNS